MLHEHEKQATMLRDNGKNNPYVARYVARTRKGLNNNDYYTFDKLVNPQ